MSPTSYRSGPREDFMGCLYVVDSRPFGGLRGASRGTRQEIAHSQDVVDREAEHEHPAHAGAPRCRVFLINPMVFSQPKISSTRLRFF